MKPPKSFWDQIQPVKNDALALAALDIMRRIYHNRLRGEDLNAAILTLPDEPEGSVLYHCSYCHDTGFIHSSRAGNGYARKCEACNGALWKWERNRPRPPVTENKYENPDDEPPF